MKFKKFTSVLALCLLTVTSCSDKNPVDLNIFKPTYSTTRNYNEYKESNLSGVKEFTYNSVTKFDEEMNNRNYVFSPLSYFDGLAILSQFSHYETPLYQALGYESNEKLAEVLKSFRSGYNFVENTKNNIYQSRLASAISILNEVGELEYSENVKNKLNNLQTALLTHGTEEGDEEQVNWLNDATFNLFDLKDPFTSKTDLLAIFSTLAYQISHDFGSAKVDFNGQSVDGFAETIDGARYHSDENFVSAEINLNKEKLVFMMPEEGKDLDLTSVLNTISKAETSDIKLKAPFFKVNNEHDLEKLTKDSKLSYLFDEPAMTDILKNSNMPIYKVLQNTMFEVNEDGVSGAAITVIKVPTSIGPNEKEYIEININKPFYFGLFDENYIPLFFGHISTL